MRIYEGRLRHAFRSASPAQIFSGGPSCYSKYLKTLPLPFLIQAGLCPSWAQGWLGELW